MSCHLFFLYKKLHADYGADQLNSQDWDIFRAQFFPTWQILALTNSLISPISAARGCEKFCHTEHWHSILPNVPDVLISTLYLVPDALYLADVGAQRPPNCGRCANESQSIQCNDSTLAMRRWQILRPWSSGFNPAWCSQCADIGITFGAGRFLSRQCWPMFMIRGCQMVADVPANLLALSELLQYSLPMCINKVMWHC